MVISRVSIVMSHIRGRITPFITTHEPPVRERNTLLPSRAGFGCARTRPARGLPSSSSTAIWRLIKIMGVLWSVFQYTPYIVGGPKGAQNFDQPHMFANPRSLLLMGRGV